MKKNTKFIIALIAVFVLSSVLGSSITIGYYYKRFGINPLTSNHLIAFDGKKVDSVNVNKFNQVRSYLENDFYQEVDENVLIEGAIAGMADSLKDPYTVYYNKEQMKEFTEKSEGSYVGIGVSVVPDGNGILTVSEAFPDSPAKQAGILTGDKIVKVDDEDVTTIKDEETIINKIKGEENTKVKITVYRSKNENEKDNETGKSSYIDFEIIRKKIKIANTSKDVLRGNIGYIRIITFDSSISEQFNKDLTELKSKKIKGLIIDLRNNPGGSYQQVVNIANYLLPEGTIVSTENRKGEKEIEKSDAQFVDIPLAVLINENSASASEVLAGALKDNNRAKLIGKKTFGKGVVQELRELLDGSGLKITISRYFTPSGECIHGKGIEPDIDVGLPDKLKNYSINQIPKDQDTQLNRAIEYLLNGSR